MEWLIVLSLLIIGLILIIVEVIFVPGTTVVGFIGFGIMLIGAWLAYGYFDQGVFWGIMGGTTLLSTIIFIWVFRAKPWQQFALKTASQSKVNEGITDGLKEGDEGVTVSVLRPVGKAEIGDKTVEVSTLGNYVQSGTPIRIIKISSNNILVEPLTN